MATIPAVVSRSSYFFDGSTAAFVFFAPIKFRMLNRFAGLLILLVLSQFSFAQSIVSFKTSKPYAVLSFTEAASGAQQHSRTFSAFIESNIPSTDTVFRRLSDDFREINLQYTFKREEFPANRRQHRSTYDLIVIAAVKSVNLAEFRSNTIGILPNSNHTELFRILQAAEKYYDRFIWNTSKPSIDQQVLALKKYSTEANELFSLFRHFYGSSWSDDIPFNVAIFPIPGKTGNTSATPHANSLCVGVLTEKQDAAGVMGVVVHEMCHVLYDEQISSFQYQLDSAFTSSPSPFKTVAYNFFDEALATALGNGWAYQRISGKADTSSWYNNEYINGFAHALYPLVSQYLTSRRTIDTAFIGQAIRIFGETYPRSLSDYSIMLNNMYLYADAEKVAERQALRNVLGKYFQSSRYSFSSPILHEYSIRSLKESRPAQLIIVDRDHDSTLAVLKGLFPEIDGFLKGHNDAAYVLSFYDQQKRPVILISVTNKEELDKALSLLKQKKYLDPAVPYMPIK